MQIGEKEKTVMYPKRTVTRPAPAGPFPAEGWPVKKDANTPIAAPEWPRPATVQPHPGR